MADVTFRWDSPMLVVVSGLPATGKSTAAGTIAGRVGAAYLRIDTIEQSIVSFAADRADGDAVRHAVAWGLGYEVAYGVATDLLSQGLHVFAECVNPMKITRDAWLAAARRADAQHVAVELVCSDPAEHERRARWRTVDVPGLVLPTWQEIVDRDYEPWDREHIVVDTAGRASEQTIAELCVALGID